MATERGKGGGEVEMADHGSNKNEGEQQRNGELFTQND